MSTESQGIGTGSTCPVEETGVFDQTEDVSVGRDRSLGLCAQVGRVGGSETLWNPCTESKKETVVLGNVAKTS